MAKTKGEITGNRLSKSRLIKIRNGLSSLQKEILNEVWQSHLKGNEWPLARGMYLLRGRKKVAECVKSLGGNIIFEMEGGASKNRYELTIIGVLLTEAGDEYFDLLFEYLEFVRQAVMANPSLLAVTDQDFRKEKKLSDAQIDLMAKVVRMARLWGGGQFSGKTWTHDIPNLVEDFPDKGVLGVLEEELFKVYQQNTEVLVEDRRKQLAVVAPHNDFLGFQSMMTLQKSAFVADKRERRYQVFVSSTYEDLKKERQHVIQALLESECIPVGMELFPASSEEQWGFIKKVIQQCDYYIVIVAGRYGSKHTDGLSYTEKEFDYALSIGKPVVGFCHKCIDNLPLRKVDKKLSDQKRLSIFRKKVQNGRVVKFWKSAADLGSQVKTAIASQTKQFPMPGWVRADVGLASDEAEKLREENEMLKLEINNLKSKKKPAKLEQVVNVKIQIDIGYDFKEYDETEFSLKIRVPKKRIDHTLCFSVEDAILHLGLRLRSGDILIEMVKAIAQGVYGQLCQSVAVLLKQTEPDFEYKVYEDSVEMVLNTLVAYKYVKSVPSQWGWSTPAWRFTEKGLQRFAELQILRANGGSIE